MHHDSFFVILFNGELLVQNKFTFCGNCASIFSSFYHIGRLSSVNTWSCLSRRGSGPVLCQVSDQSEPSPASAQRFKLQAGQAHSSLVGCGSEMIFFLIRIIFSRFWIQNHFVSDLDPSFQVVSDPTWIFSRTSTVFNINLTGRYLCILIL